MENHRQTLINYPVDIENKLGFDVVKSLIKEQCHTELGIKKVEQIKFNSNQNKLFDSLNQVDEIQSIFQKNIFFHWFEELEKILTYLNYFNTEGLYLNGNELLSFKLFLEHHFHNNQVIYNNIEVLQTVSKICSDFPELKQCIQKIDIIIDKEGKVKDNASSELQQISKEINERRNQVRKILIAKFEFAKKNGWAGDTEITLRNERLVIPIIAEHKRKIQGFVHDDSQSGKFLYIEPIECFENNNEIIELEIERKKEIERILKQLSAELSPFKIDFFHQVQVMAELDFICAKAHFSNKINGVIPSLTYHFNDIELVNARHPLLYLNFSKNNKKLVPLHFYTEDNIKMTVISGPNAGGKSITLKTIGLLQYMFQCGIPVPLESHSKMAIFKSIFIDIGDNQSIENNLSSYSSHLMNMKHCLTHANSGTLVLIDEIGNGTDPSIGGTIAQAMLEELLIKQCFAVVTTHYGNLKTWASHTDLVQNARMQYDLIKLEPLFKLEIGKTGSSFAMEVAGKVGISKTLLNKAKTYSKQRESIDLEELMSENERNKLIILDTNKRLSEKETTLNKLIAEYQQLKTEIAKQKHDIIKIAKNEAVEIVKKAGKEVEKTIKNIKEIKAEKNKTKVLRENLEEFKRSLEPEKIDKIEIYKTALPKEIDTKSKQLQIGDTVKQIGQNTKGEIITLKKNEAQVAFGHITMWLPLEQLEKTSRDKQKPKPQTATFNVHLYDKQTNFSMELDLRGVRGEEAIDTLEKWLIDANLLGFSSLKIIHGRGHGILRKLVHNKLKAMPFVKNYEHENEQLGGDGVTLVYLK